MNNGALDNYFQSHCGHVQKHVRGSPIVLQLVNQLVFMAQKKLGGYLLDSSNSFQNLTPKYKRQFYSRNRRLFPNHPNHFYTFFLFCTFALRTLSYYIFFSHPSTSRLMDRQARRYFHAIGLFSPRAERPGVDGEQFFQSCKKIQIRSGFSKLLEMLLRWSSGLLFYYSLRSKL